MAPETPLGGGDENGSLTNHLTVQSDVVLSGAPNWDEGAAWLGQPGNGSLYNISRFPSWRYGLACARPLPPLLLCVALLTQCRLQTPIQP